MSNSEYDARTTREPAAVATGARPRGEAPLDYRALFEQAPAAYLVVATDAPRWTILDASDAYLAATLTTRDEVIGRGTFEVFPESEGTQSEGGERHVSGSFARVVATGARDVLPVQRYDVPLPAAQGGGFEERYWELASQPVRDDRGRIVAVVHHVADVTHRVLGDRDLAAATRRTTEVLESISDAFFALDSEWRFTYVNARAEEVLFRTRGELLGRSLWEAFPEAVGSTFDSEYRRAVRDRVTVRFEQHFPPLDTWFAVSAYPSAQGLSVYFQDVTARRRAEEERERALRDAETARAEAEEANRSKSAFLATMSHELRTPLNAIGGYAELLDMGLRGPVTAEQRADLSRIRRSQQHLLGLINDVLNFARLDAGRVDFEYTTVDVRATLAAVEALVAPQMAAKGHAFDAGDCAQGVTVWADAEKVAQVLVNLLTNAIKYTDPGGRIVVRCADAADTGVVTIRVSDNGIGISPEKLPSIFDPFVQVDRRLNRPNEGVGLGLAISRDLARAMRGDLTVESEIGVGSTFTFTLPRAGPS